ncbi:hypothetical protein, partial [Xanthomonas albilineans]|uniref:hypothetical protein n=1 Tax=Xanthomonas albilineans TaxID=29447 RepID=UPI0018B0B24D
MTDTYREVPRDDGLDHIRRQVRQSTHPADLAKVDAFGLRDLGHGIEPSLVQQTLPVVRQAEYAHQRGVLRHLAHLPLTAGLLAELLRRIQRGD